MALDPKPFTDLGYGAWLVEPEPMEGETLFVQGLDHHAYVTAENYDTMLHRAEERKDNAALMKASRQMFKDNYQNWPTMTAQQKDTANRNAQRAIAALIGHAIQDS